MHNCEPKLCTEAWNCAQPRVEPDCVTLPKSEATKPWRVCAGKACPASEASIWGSQCLFYDIVPRYRIVKAD